VTPLELRRHLRYGETVIDGNDDLLSGLPEVVRRLLAEPPATEKKLLELGLAWNGLPSTQAWVAEQLRVFVITWDPLERLVPRPDGFASVNADPSGFELVVYLPVWTVVEKAVKQGGTVSAVLTAMAGSAVVIAAAQEQSATPAGRARRQSSSPDLLCDPAAGVALGVPEVRLVSPHWEDIGLGAITDIVQNAFGPVDLDRSVVELAAAARPRSGCPACHGRRFGFPGELADAQPGMCPAHQGEAEKVIRTRLARANASNPDGWGALGDATIHLEQPHLPNGLATKLAGADEGMYGRYVVPEPDELAERARLVVEAASWFPGRLHDFAVALGAEPELPCQLPDWLINLVLDLGRAGLGAEAVRVGEALTRIDPDLQAMLDGDVAVALAQAGMAEQARARIESNLIRWPDDFWNRIHAGDALAALGDRDGAVTHFDAALRMAEAIDDFEARFDAIERLRVIGRYGPAERRQPGTQQRRQPRRCGPSRRKRKR
jgi:hypothetical protein